MRVKNDRQWICTDPDCNQYGRKIGDKLYEFKQDCNFIFEETGTTQFEINLNEYTEKEKENHLSSFGYTLEELYNEFLPEDAEWLIAECIFENEAL